LWARAAPDYHRGKPLKGAQRGAAARRIGMADYAEFGLLEGNAREYGIAWTGPPELERISLDVGSGQRISGIRWGSGAPELVLLHGGAQNAHTWDTLLLALGRPALALDLPGHGHSDWREDRDYGPERNAPAIASAIRALAPRARLLIGMSLGGLTAFAVASRFPELVRELAVVDVTPGVNRAKSKAIVDFVRGPEFFAGFDEILARTIAHNPTRSEQSLRRGVLHNARELPDGRWSWRYDRNFAGGGGPVPEIDFGAIWEHVSRVRCPITLLRGALSPVVGDEDVAELLRRQPAARVQTVAGAGHSIQGDRPLELAAILAKLLAG
jgi:pimeloyl-ACP methyl ester carboxylesterase